MRRASPARTLAERDKNAPTTSALRPVGTGHGLQERFDGVHAFEGDRDRFQMRRSKDGLALGRAILAFLGLLHRQESPSFSAVTDVRSGARFFWSLAFRPASLSDRTARRS